ncbi:TPA: hypothetical protein IGZ65_004760 [Escherichia coli]|nr:hypothetical protein [Escherichia coli]
MKGLNLASLTFNNPAKLHVGLAKFGQLGNIAQQYGNKTLLVFSASFRLAEPLARAQEALTPTGMTYVVYDKFIQNSLSPLVEVSANLNN